MMEIPPKSSREFKPPNTTPLDRSKLIEQVTAIINASAPYLESIQIHNQTKHCTVTLGVSNHVMHIRILDPRDEQFNILESIDEFDVNK